MRISAVLTVTIHAGRSTGIPTTASRLPVWKNACRMCMRTTVFRPARPTGEWRRTQGESGTATTTSGGCGEYEVRGVCQTTYCAVWITNIEATTVTSVIINE